MELESSKPTEPAHLSINTNTDEIDYGAITFYNLKRTTLAPESTHAAIVVIVLSKFLLLTPMGPMEWPNLGVTCTEKAILCPSILSQKSLLGLKQLFSTL